MRMSRVSLMIALLGTLACTSAIGASRATAKPAASPVVPAAKFPLVVKSSDGSIEAHFDGETPPAELRAPLRFGTSRLWFTFAGDKTAYEFHPLETLEFSDWIHDVFSPDGKWVLLPQGHYGPYHVVAAGDLKAYLQGKAKPAKVLQEPVAGTQQALVHLDGHWVSSDEVEYRVGGVTPETRHARVP